MVFVIFCLTPLFTTVLGELSLNLSPKANPYHLGTKYAYQYKTMVQLNVHLERQVNLVYKLILIFKIFLLVIATWFEIFLHCLFYTQSSLF